MTDIDIKTLTYGKQEIDAKILVEREYTDNELLKKVDTTLIGASNGITPLFNGKVPATHIPFATSQDASDGTRDDVAMSPKMVRQELNDVAYKYIPLTQKGASDGVATLDGNNKIPVSQIPDTGSVSGYYVDTIDQMLNLTGIEEGDRCLVLNNASDSSKNGEYVATKDNPTLENDWRIVPTYNAVTSVNGEVGVVTLGSQEIPEIATNATNIGHLRTDVDVNTADIATNVDKLNNLEMDSLKDVSTSPDRQYDFPITWTDDGGSGMFKADGKKLSTENLSTDVVSYREQATEPTHTEGNVYYKDGTLNIQSLGGSTIQVGQESWITVYNSSGATLTKGTPVCTVGSNAGYIAVEPAIASDFVTANVTGVCIMDIPDRGYGTIITYGAISGVDMSAFNEGDILYLSDTVEGGLVSADPYAPNIATGVGVCLNNSASGEMLVKIRNVISLPTIIAKMTGQNSNTYTLPANTWRNVDDYRIGQNVVIPYDLVNGMFTCSHVGWYSLSFTFNGTISDNRIIFSIELYDVTHDVVLVPFEIISSDATPPVPISTSLNTDFLIQSTNTVVAMRIRSATDEDVIINNVDFTIKLLHAR